MRKRGLGLYDNMPMHHTAIFTDVEYVNFQMKLLIFFLSLLGASIGIASLTASFPQ